ncbi:hypothetical protein [Paenisporosarcina indica]|uniref:hypothetical protein n=1 Tax=Paenisporosarcina indica TaxID=650093 RepID=UPI00094F7D56|nr:hypothetical protein [Paenisporosarcina indica]
MSKNNLIVMLKTLCKYNNVEIKHTFSIKGQPQIVVRCLRDTSTIEITNLATNTIELYDDLGKAAERIQLVTNTDITS